MQNNKRAFAGDAIGSKAPARRKRPKLDHGGCHDSQFLNLAAWASVETIGADGARQIVKLKEPLILRPAIVRLLVGLPQR